MGSWTRASGSRADAAMRSVRANASLLAGLVLTTAFIATAVLSLFWLPADPAIPDIRHRLLPFNAPGHLLGTDVLGRDVVAEIMLGSRTSMAVGAGGAMIGLLVGALAGLLAAGWGRLVDESVSRGADILLSIPGIVT